MASPTYNEDTLRKHLLEQTLGVHSRDLTFRIAARDNTN
jgi:hypothetical protein